MCLLSGSFAFFMHIKVSSGRDKGKIREYYTGLSGITVLNDIIEKILALSKGKILGTDLLFLSSRSESRSVPILLNPSGVGP